MATVAFTLELFEGLEGLDPAAPRGAVPDLRGILAPLAALG